MKSKRQMAKIILICTLLLLIMLIFNKSYGASIGAIFTGILSGGTLVTVLVEVIQVGAVAIATAVNALIAAVTAIGAPGDSAVFGIKEIVFNQCPITTADFFGLGISSNYYSDFTSKIGEFYNIIRNLSIAVLLGILLYIGIRMAISTVAEEEAKYKKMLMNWGMSLVLVFVLHYIMIITFAINDTLVKALYDVANGNASLDAGGTRALEASMLAVNAIVPIVGIPDAIVYCAFTTATCAFLFDYIKRIISLGFLIVISPLITITYSIDKIGDGRSQALNTWLKEFIFTVLIQPFHCLIYLVFVNTALQLVIGNVGDGDVFSSLGEEILAIASVFFMLKAENIVKKIFGLQADSMGNTMETGAMVLGMTTGLFKSAGKNASGKVPKMNNKNEAPANTTRTANTNSGGNVNSGENANPEGNANQGGNINPGGNTNPGGSTNPGGNINPGGNASQGGNANQNSNSNEKIKEAVQKAQNSKKGNWFEKNMVNPVNSYFQRISGEEGAAGVTKGALKFGLTNGAAAFAGIAGATVKDGSLAMSSAMAAKAAAEGIYSSAEGRASEIKAEENQQVMAGAYNDFATAYRDVYDPDASDEEIDLVIEDLLSKEGTELKTDFERDMYNQARLIVDTGESQGYKDGTVYLRDTLRKIHSGEIKPTSRYQQYNYGSVSNNTNSNSNSSADNTDNNSDNNN